MKNETKIFLSEKGILVVMLAVFVGSFIFGYFMGFEQRERDRTIFTSEEIERILKYQSIENSEMNGGDLIVYKDYKGNLMFGWGEEIQ